MSLDDLKAAIASPDWMRDAACRGCDPDLFFPTKGHVSYTAKQVCAECPVREQCLEFALENGERFGVWGGESVKERRPRIRARVAPVAACGTNSGYYRHRTLNEPACAECVEAHRVYGRERKQQTRRNRLDREAML